MCVEKEYQCWVILLFYIASSLGHNSESESQERPHMPKGPPPNSKPITEYDYGGITAIPPQFEEMVKALPSEEREFLEAALESNKKGKKSAFKESLYEPYWKSGEWVFHRVTPEFEKRRPIPPHRVTKKIPLNITTTMSTKHGQTLPKPTTPWLDYDCQHPCPEIFEDFGEVCGQMFDGMAYHQKQFRDICDLLAMNCLNPIREKEEFERLKTERIIPKKAQPRRGEWRILYKGPCYELTTHYWYMPTMVKDLLSRASYLDHSVKAVKEVTFAKDRDNSIYPRTPISTLSTKRF